jgi:hypothetical protein
MAQGRATSRSRSEKEELYRALFAEQEVCGLTLGEVSRQTGIPPTTLSWWKGEICRRDGSEDSAPARRGGEGAEVAFLPVAIQSAGGDPVPPPGVVEISLPGGAAVRVPAVFEDDVLRRVVRILTESC